MEHDTSRPRHRRRLLTILAAAGVLAAVPAGVALAGGSDSPGGEAPAGGSAGEVQSTAPDGRQPDGRDGGRDCPKDRGQDRQEAVEL